MSMANLGELQKVDLLTFQYEIDGITERISDSIL